MNTAQNKQYGYIRVSTYMLKFLYAAGGPNRIIRDHKNHLTCGFHDICAVLY